GLRPKIPPDIPELVTQSIMRCWDAQPDERPTSEELHAILYEWQTDLRKDKSY
ncbi:10564_t:CDS:1, partial [Racocetra fulgida]